MWVWLVKMASSLGSKVSGSLLGLAVCDAVGTAVEFMSPGSFQPVVGMTGGGPFRLQPGQWTDDTSMMLCLAESLIECQGFNPIDQSKRYLKWYQEGHLSSTGECFDIGMTVRTALNTFQRSKGTDPYPGSASPRAAGNGCLMRLCPVPLMYHKQPELAMELSGLSARVTHGPPAAIDACRYFAGLLIGCLNGVSKEELLSEMYSPIPGGYWETHPMVDEVSVVARGSYKVKEPPDIKGTGYIVNTLEAVLWAFHHSSNFKDGCLKAVNLGDDADTVGAIYGQLAGAYYGVDSIPMEWLELTSFRGLIELFGDELVGLSDKIHHENVLTSWPDPVHHEQLSDEYRIRKLECFDMLERLSQETIYRFAKPCPKQYTSLEHFNKDIENIKKEFSKLPSSTENNKMLTEFERIWNTYRTSVSQRLGRQTI